MTAKAFIETLKIIGQDYSGEIPKRELFSLAKAYQQIPVSEVVKLLKDENVNHRLGAVSILDWKARHKKTSKTEREKIYSAYIDNHKWIDNWGLVDRSAPYVVGGYLHDKDKKALYDLAKSKNPMERRTAIVSTYYFIRKNEIEDTFEIAEILVYDTDESVQKAVGSWIREAGKQNEEKLKKFLDKHASDMPRITLRYAIEKFDKKSRAYYLNLKKQAEKPAGNKDVNNT
ncbi:DNA alkylation repair protein [Subsaximicrobium wynnwilliamsii]|uniref:DNA alkylation repair protein n=1 Tax=Subsaximicrobium wynnwilliamsii TaxID=291179 RepID=A0A5C6ZF54_9FLAO|nr:DNA alkylation repair protein [Subsaximicrobium wynnwilliamsii]TXD82228.1 DNA alkylation repair protein [Subsaximicrobium wynnwilliamsii]TXD87868.1 DNA alkylation repair protein [Subsaximicrobium wynnwilliamsii]TXE01818.1 DNA alkylation repair protein [Subsaximicrobium wynnwilliamsii]